MRLLAVMAVMVGLAGCERAGHEPDPVALPMPKVTVTLIDPGSEPRQQIRLHVQVGQRVTYRFTDQTELGYGSNRVERKFIEISDGEALESQGDVLHVRATVRAVSIEPAPKTTDPTLLIGTTSDTWTDPRGARVRPTLMRTREPDPRSLVPRPELFIIAPEEPVGVGARWHEEIAYGESSASVDVQLLARDGTRIQERLDYKAERRSAHQWVTVQGSTILDTDTASPDSSSHGSNRLVVHTNRGDVTGTETTETVRLGP